MSEYKFLDDIAKFSNNTLNAMTSMQRQVRKWTSEQTEALIRTMDIVTKADYEAQALKIAELEARLAKLEGNTPKEEKPKAKKAAKKTESAA